MWWVVVEFSKTKCNFFWTISNARRFHRVQIALRYVFASLSIHRMNITRKMLAISWRIFSRNTTLWRSLAQVMTWTNGMRGIKLCKCRLALKCLISTLVDNHDRTWIKVVRRKTRSVCRVECEKKACQYFFAVNSDAQLENDLTLVQLIEANRFEKNSVFLGRARRSRDGLMESCACHVVQDPPPPPPNWTLGRVSCVCVGGGV